MYVVILLLGLLQVSRGAVQCTPGTYWHTRGSVDCTSGSSSCTTTPSPATCCCACHANYYCPGGTKEQPEDPCPAGSTSPPQSTSASNCTGGPPPPTGGFSQIHVAYTGNANELSIDFVGGSGKTTVWTSLDKQAWTASPATSFSHPTIGYMSAGLLRFPGAAAGEEAYYMVGDASANSSAFTVHPTLARSEVFAVYGDFGFANDVCLSDLIAEAAAGTFDSALHVGDWAYNFEDSGSSVGNNFMNAIQPFAATHPVAPVEGNHERCGSCAGVPAAGVPSGNFSEYGARMYSVGAFGAGKASGTDTPRYYSFDRGLTHFLIFSAEAYTYHSGPEFTARQLAFMKADLAAVDRSVTPWVVALVHKAWWMESNAYADFTPVLLEGKVDILFCGHWHYYNRYKPYNNITGDVDEASISADGATYTNPKYMTVIITGASGDKEQDSPYDKPFPSITGTENYGYGFFTAVSPTKATWTFKTVKPDNGAANYSDSLTILKA